MFFSLLRFLLLVCTSLLLSGCAPSTEQALTSHLESRQWRMDALGKDTLDDVIQATDWEDLTEWKSWGLGPETIWIRLQLKADKEIARTPWVIRVRPAFLDYVTLHDPASGLVLLSGDALPPDNEGIASINFMFQIPSIQHERSVYLQIRSTSARTVHAEVLPYGQAQLLNRLQEWVMGFVMASSAIFTIWAFIQWLGTREKVIGIFALKQLLATLWAFFVLGFARVVIGPWLSEGVLTTFSSMIFIGVIGVTLWFLSTLIAEYHPHRLALRAVHMLLIFIAALPIVHFMGYTHLMLSLANKSGLLALAFLLIALFSTAPKQVKQPIRFAVILGYLLIYSTLNSLPLLIHLGWMEAHKIVLFGNLTHAFMDGIVMFSMLQIRARKLRKEQMQTALELQLSQQQAEAEKRHSEEQSQLFAMLAHEMKTPLSTLRMWMEAGQLKPDAMERTIADMNQVIERCVHTGQLADHGLQPVWQTVDPLALTRTCVQSCRNPDQVDLVIPEHADPLQTDAQMLSIILANLLDNACKYGAPCSRIQVTLQRGLLEGQAGLFWKVQNNTGPAGLPDPNRLFEKYYRSPQARRLSGSGLGLFLVKGLLELMHGNIHYEVNDMQTVFCFFLPDSPKS